MIFVRKTCFLFTFCTAFTIFRVYLFDLGRAGTRSPDPRNTPDQTPRAGAGAAASPAQSAVEAKFGK